jgi:hypothetical protein
MGIWTLVAWQPCRQLTGWTPIYRNEVIRALKSTPRAEATYRIDRVITGVETLIFRGAIRELDT